MQGNKGAGMAALAAARMQVSGGGNLINLDDKGYIKADADGD